ncbi:fluoride efflux transporter CrcB [Staphylococcus haemolyticus]|uniref:fluoride efflux transporter CrcB n=1 Tax=Staphylococcus haemolyticus TaxID=1283 RepID=UPI001F0AC38D|nr:fluoride efflux transporter CrcB [Staphylococcus haemolyticus]MCH4477064.1 fluoride efflux transporter CrcB [Staphylococcus haemolyticus]MEB2656757.1 fluoride efflux transporter CrcB [Staphylococcus haemolyticus]
MQYLFVFIGGLFGALLRYVLSTLNADSGLPLGTLIANIVGTFSMGYFSSLSIQFFKNNPLIKKGVTTGLLGALTTFSTFQFELVTMSQNNSIALLFIYGLTSYIGGILLCWLGVKLGGQPT